MSLRHAKPIAIVAAGAMLAGLACIVRVEASPWRTATADGHWILLPDYSDEFDGAALDTNKWDHDVGDWGVWSWEPENAGVSNGCLLLTMQYREHVRKGKKLFYTSGIVKSRAAPIRYGYFEARMKAGPRYPGVSPDFWVYRNEKDMWTEIDFVEMLQQARGAPWMDTNIHVFRSPALPKGRKELHEHRQWRAPWDPRADFHLYACEWNDTQVTWYIDDQRVGSRTNEYWHQALDVVLSVGVRSPLNLQATATGFPVACQIDYVRVWKAAASDP